MKRREFVTGTIAGASVLSAWMPSFSVNANALSAELESQPPVATVKRPGRIDIHHHIFPDVYRYVAEAKGIHLPNTSFPKWSAEQSLAVLDANEIQTAITSLPQPGVFFGEAKPAAELARRCNEFAADLATRHAGRFGSFASIPLPATELACAEAIYALDTLKADGIVLLGNSGGVFLGDPRLEELMAELDRRKATVFVHPNLHETSLRLGLAEPNLAIELASDTTRAAVNLILTGTLERFPNIKWIMANACGFLPYAAWRLSLANAMPDLAEKAPQGVMNYLRWFYYDTAMAPSAYTMANLKELVPTSQILFGTDSPWTTPQGVTRQIDVLSPNFTEEEQKAVYRSNALGLFPRLAVANERISYPAQHESESTSQWLKRTAKKPLGSIAQYLRNR